MKMKPEERPKVIALGGATALVLAYVVFSTAARLNAANGGSANTNAANGNMSAGSVSPASSAAASPQGAMSIVSTPVSGSGGGFAGADNMPAVPSGSLKDSVKGTKLDLYAESLNEPPVTRDPFTPVTPQSGNYRVSAAAAAPPRPAFSAPSPTVRPLPGPAIMPAAPPRPESAFTLPNGKSPLDDVLLAGVIAGPYSVAVLHIGDRSYELVGGERLPYGLIVTRITDSGVYLRNGSHLVFVEIGKTLRGAMPIRQNGGMLRDPGRTLLSAMPVPSHGEVTVENDEPVQPPSREIATE